VEASSDSRKKVIAAGDWKTLDGEHLYKRLTLHSQFGEKLNIDERLEKELSNMRPLKDAAGEIIGRACITLMSNRRKDGLEGGIVTVGGLRANEIRYLFGILNGTPASATRNTAIPVVEQDELARWATEQAKLIQKLYKEHGVLSNFAQVIRICGGDTGRLPIAFAKDGWKSAYDISRWKKAPNEIFIVRDYDAGYEPRNRKLVMDVGVLAVSEGYFWPLLATSTGQDAWPKSPVVDLSGNMTIKNTLKMAVIESLARAWSTSFQDILHISDFSRSEHRVGRQGKSVARLKADVIRNPHYFGDNND
jgi:hypothetical protein